MKILKKTAPIMMFLFAVLICFVGCDQEPQSIDPSIIENFKTPPNEAKPRVWWHWMNGNISKHGIRKDLEWMNRAGIGGFQNFDANLATPKVVEERLTYMTPKWKDAFRFTTHLADSLGLEMAIAASPGWSETGGPWVEPKDGMKKYVWSETLINGGSVFNGKLPNPPTTSGPFQGAPLDDAMSVLGNMPEAPEYYKDIAVIAYKVPENDILISQLNPKITSSTGEKYSLTDLTDGDIHKSTFLSPAPVGEYSWVQYEFPKAVTIKSLTISAGGPLDALSQMMGVETRNFEISDDGKNFKKVQDLPRGPVAQKTFTLPSITAKYFRFNFLTQAPPPPNPLIALFGITLDSEIKGTEIAEINLGTITRINKFEEKAAFATAMDIYEHPTPETSDIINLNDVLDITSKMKPDGSLEWDAPEGDWVILRFGFSLTGRHNHPASPEATGLEVDKLDPVAVKAYIENYLDQYKDATGGLMGDKGGLGYIITDSWEAGTANWTDNMMEEFEKRRGYSLIPWMPVLTGKVVKSAKESDNFLFDLRATLGEMVKEYHYDVLSASLHARGMKRYTESHESNRAYIGDGMSIKSTADIPMSALWAPGPFYMTPAADGGPAVMNKADIRESASVAHLYGQKYIAAESLTSMGVNSLGFYPEILKPIADMELASGLNRFVIHTSAHQPVDDKFPGLGLGPFGQWFTRHETWSEQAKAWTAYLSRSSFMLQQGKFVADVVYYYGEDSNITALFGQQLPDIPEGYSYDFINPDALVNLLSTNNGNLTTPSGMNYKVLVLDKNSRYMSLSVLKKMENLVKQGAVVVGSKPIGSPSLSDDKALYDSIINEVWNASNKNVYSDVSLADVLSSLKVTPDFQYTKPKDDSNLLFVHRKLDNSEFYWVNNRKNRVEDLTASFRVTGKKVEIWNPETGEIKQVSYKTENGITSVPLHLEPNDAFFVVFNGNTDKTEFTIANKAENILTDIKGSWNVQFQKERGAPESIILNDLIPWTEHEDAGVKYFSGTASYTKTLNISKDWIKETSELWLDLGDVKNIAEVFINGKSQQILWKKPFRVNITNALKEGDNQLEIRVTNVWANRLIGDQQPDAEHKIGYTTLPFFTAESTLLTSGLLGPVQLLEKKQ